MVLVLVLVLVLVFPCSWIRIPKATNVIERLLGRKQRSSIISLLGEFGEFDELQPSGLTGLESRLMLSLSQMSEMRKICNGYELLTIVYSFSFGPQHQERMCLMRSRIIKGIRWRLAVLKLDQVGSIGPSTLDPIIEIPIRNSQFSSRLPVQSVHAILFQPKNSISQHYLVLMDFVWRTLSLSLSLSRLKRNWSKNCE